MWELLYRVTPPTSPCAQGEVLTKNKPYTSVYNDQIFLKRRQELRKNTTPTETILWSYLRKRQIYNLRFFRQYSVGPYILDFYCPTIRLAIELDGSQHEEKDAQAYDKDRTNFLNEHKISVLRFKNHDVIHDIEKIIEEISKSCLPSGRTSP